jgi:hypothetical protein
MTSDLDARIRETMTTIARCAPEPRPYDELPAIGAAPARAPQPRRRPVIVAVLVATLVAAVAVGAAVVVSNRSGTTDAAPVHRAPAPVSSATHGPVSIRLTLPRATLRAGARMTGSVAVTNRTGAAIPFSYCNSIFAVALEGARYQQTFMNYACLQHGQVPIGESTYVVTVFAVASFCTTSPRPPVDAAGYPFCDANGSPPAVPSGRYRARLELMASGAVGPMPKPIPIRVLPAR